MSIVFPFTSSEVQLGINLSVKKKSRMKMKSVFWIKHFLSVSMNNRI